ncbi:MAG: VCBS repeat-containing protein [Flavobacteriales bacterium]|nr:VCBS repeat-containing protein [Flavobacteriales bacterium]
MGDTPNGGNYGSIWIDYNNDHLIDLFIAKCRGGQQVPASVDQLHRNNGDGTFTEVTVEMGLSDYQQTWSSAWADYDMDGDMDILIGASSFAQGGHKLMRNDGNTFTNVTEGSGFDVFPGTSIEWVAHDFNNDGWVDVLGASNTIHFNNGDRTFTPTVVSEHWRRGRPQPRWLLRRPQWRHHPHEQRQQHQLPTGEPAWHLEQQEWHRRSRGGDQPHWHQIRDVKSGDGFRYMSFFGAHFGLPG